MNLKLTKLLAATDFVSLASNANVVLVSLSQIIILQSGTDYIIELKKFFSSNAKQDPCPVYDIQIYSDEWLIAKDTVEQHDTTSKGKGLFSGLLRVESATVDPEVQGQSSSIYESY